MESSAAHFVTIKLHLTEAQAFDLLSQLAPLQQKSRTALTSEDYESLYWSGRSALSLAKEYGVNHNHFIRVWKAMGLDTVLLPSERPARKARLEADEARFEESRNQ